MRYISKNIYYILKNHKKMFIFMAVVQIASIMLFMYCYGILQNKQIKQLGIYDVLCEFNAGFLKRDSVTNRYSLDKSIKFSDMKKIIDEVRSDIGKDIFYIRFILAESEEALNEHRICPLCCYSVTKESYHIMCKEYGAPFFSWDDMSNGCGRVYLNSQHELLPGEQDKTGEYFIFSGKRYKIVKKANCNSLQMAYMDIPDDVYVIGIDLYLHEIPNIKKQKEISTKLKNWFNIEEEDIEEPYKYEDLLGREYIALTLAVNFFICFIIALNALLIYRYMLEKRKKWIFVMHLNGCGFDRICFYFVAEMAMVMMLCLMAALFLYHKIIFPVAGGDTAMGSVIYEGRLYSYSLITYVIISLLGCLICAKKVISNYRKKMVSVLEEAKLWEN